MLGDYKAGDVIDLTFTTRSNGVLAALASGAVSIYKGNSTTESTSGVTLTADFDSRTGLNQVHITTASDGTFYAGPNEFSIVLTGGTVGGVSVVGLVIETFSIGRVSADVASVQADTDDLQTRIPAALVSGRIDASVGAMATDTLTSAALASSAVTEIQSGLSTLDASGVRAAIGLASANLDTQLAALAAYVDTEVAAIKAKTDNLPSDPADASDIAASFSSIASTLTTIASYIDTEVAAIKAKTDNLPASPAATGDIPSAATIASATAAQVTTDHGSGSYIRNTEPLDAAGVRTAVGLASANLDTQIDALPTNAELATALASADDATLAAIAALNNLSQANIRTAIGMSSANLDTQLAALLTTAMSESYAADGAAPSVAQALFLIQQRLTEFAIVGTTTTVKKLNGSTTAAVLTHDDATSPTSSTRTA